jgi:hypothetical protein
LGFGEPAAECLTGTRAKNAQLPIVDLLRQSVYSRLAEYEDVNEVLDMDSTEIPVYGAQEQSAYNGHFESTCYHPLLLFNRDGDCLVAKLRPGNVHSAEGWEEFLLPEIERQQKLGKEVVFRADAAFAKPLTEVSGCKERRISSRSAMLF